jgi:hypothetical protein
MIRTLKQTISAGETWVIDAVASNFRLLETSGAVTVKFYRHGAEVGAADDMEAGFSSDGELFERVTIYSGTTQAVKFSVSDGGMKYDRSSGSVSVTNYSQQGAYTQAPATVTNATGQLLAANPARHALMIQNKDAAGNIFVTLSGAAATLTNGFKIAPGANMILDVFAPTGAIMAIGDIASNANIVVAEG